MNWAQGTTHPLIGRDVHVVWKDDDADWSAYTVADYYDGWILLRGRPEDGSPFNGGDIFVPMKSIELIETESER